MPGLRGYLLINISYYVAFLKFHKALATLYQDFPVITEVITEFKSVDCEPVFNGQLLPVSCMAGIHSQKSSVG